MKLHLSQVGAILSVTNHRLDLSGLATCHNRKLSEQVNMAENVKKFQGRVAIVTGASSGIGLETAVHFSRLGALLSITGRNIEKLNETAALIKKHSERSPCITVGDLVDENVVRAVVDNTVKEFGKIDILVNNAGVINHGSIDNTSLEDYDACMNINVRTVYHLTMLAVPHLKKTQGAIVNVSSVTGTKSFPFILPYCMSKAAIDQFTKCTALELAPHKVRVNGVNPGVIITDIHKRGGMSEEAYEKFLTKSKTTHALGRPGTVDEVSSVIAFLASDESSYVTGEHIHIDGGRHAMCPR